MNRRESIRTLNRDCYCHPGHVGQYKPHLSFCVVEGCTELSNTSYCERHKHLAKPLTERKPQWRN